MKRGTGWPIAVGTILGATVALNVWIARVATRDPSVAIEPNYYQKAMHWDDEMAQRSRNVSLGWTLTPLLRPAVADSSPMLDVALADRTGAPLTGARVAVVAIHNLRASQPVTLLLLESRSGDYHVAFPAWRRGMWELRFDVLRGTDRFTADMRVDADRMAQRGP